MCNSDCSEARPSYGGTIAILKPTSINSPLTLNEECALRLVDDAATGRTMATLDAPEKSRSDCQVLIQYVLSCIEFGDMTLTLVVTMAIFAWIRSQKLRCCIGLTFPGSFTPANLFQ